MIEQSGKYKNKNKDKNRILNLTSIHCTNNNIDCIIKIYNKKKY